MDIYNFNTLFHSGGYTLKALIKLHQDGLAMDWYFTNENRDIEWQGNLYRSVPMSYRPPNARDGVPTDGTLEIDIDIQGEAPNGELRELLEWFDYASDKAEMQVVAIIHDDQDVRPLNYFRHQHGTVNWNGRKITWSMGYDDRLQMQTNAVTFDFDSLTG